jgi:hypothetical protein
VVVLGGERVHQLVEMLRRVRTKLMKAVLLSLRVSATH